VQLGDVGPQSIGFHRSVQLFAQFAMTGTFALSEGFAGTSVIAIGNMYPEEPRSLKNRVPSLLAATGPR
jgi:hypothetical protein